MAPNPPNRPPRLRTARQEDAAMACEVLIRSVQEVCVKDHHHDQEILKAWCANKRPEVVASWIANPGMFMVVAEEAPHSIIGAAMYERTRSEIQLLYLVPEGLHRGLGAQLLATLETEAISLGHREVHLSSTTTARGFYQRYGYQESGAPLLLWGKMRVYPMRKTLGVQS